MRIYPKRLLKAVVYTGCSMFFILHEHGTNYLGAKQRWTPIVEAWAEETGGFVGGAVSLIWFLVSLASLIFFAKGIFFWCTVNIQSVPAVEISLKEMFRKPCSGYNSEETNIERMKQFRGNKIGILMNSEAVEEYKKTAWVDSLTSDNNTHTKSVRRFIDSSLACKTNEQGYEWLKKMNN